MHLGRGVMPRQLWRGVKVPRCCLGVEFRSCAGGQQTQTAAEGCRQSARDCGWSRIPPAKAKNALRRALPPLSSPRTSPRRSAQGTDEELSSAWLPPAEHK